MSLFNEFRKKIFHVVVISAVGLCAFALASCEEPDPDSNDSSASTPVDNYQLHEQTEATCTQVGTLAYFTKNEDDSVYYIVENNEYKEVSYDHLILPMLDHNFVGGAEKTVKNATCSEEGIMHKTCKNCGKEDTVDNVLPKVAHTYEKKKETLLIQPLCNSMGSKKIFCDNCTHEETVLLPSTGHDFDDEYTVTVLEPTCSTLGIKHRQCKNCLTEDKTDIDIPLLPHCYDSGEGKVVKSSTCTEKGSKVLLCDNCQAQSDIYVDLELAEHHFEKKSHEATCVSFAYTVETCADCKYEDLSTKQIFEELGLGGHAHVTIKPSDDNDPNVISECEYCHVRF